MVGKTEDLPRYDWKITLAPGKESLVSERDTFSKVGGFFQANIFFYSFGFFFLSFTQMSTSGWKITSNLIL